MKTISRRPRHYNAINVKVPEFITDIIDINLKEGKILHLKGFVGRAHFVETTVIDRLFELSLLSQQEVDDLKNRRIKNKPRRKLSIKKD